MSLRLGEMRHPRPCPAVRARLSAREALLDLPNVRAVDFCPEDDAFGTPCATPDIHGGNGFDVLDGGHA